MDKYSPLGFLLGCGASAGIFAYGESVNSNPGLAWLFRPFLWILVPIALFALIAGATVAALVASKSTENETAKQVGFCTGLWACYEYVFNQELSFRSIALSLLIAFVAYAFISWIVGSVVGGVKSSARNRAKA